MGECKPLVAGPCVCVEIPGRTFPVAEYRLEDAVEATGYICEPDSEFAIGAQPSKAGGVLRTCTRPTLNLPHILRGSV